MSKGTDTYEATKFEGTVTIISSANPLEYGEGNVEVEGSVFTDNILENTVNLGVNIEGINLKHSYITIPDIISPDNPISGNSIIYIENGILKSKNSSGVVTIFQSTNTKGDLLTHDGTTQIRLPVGLNGSALVADSSTVSGLKWDIISSNGNTYNFKFTIIGNNITTRVIQYYYGAYIMCVYPLIQNGSSCIFFSSKSSSSIVGNTNRFVSAASLIENKILRSQWFPYKEIELYKDYIPDDGEYIVVNNSINNKNTVTLTSTNWTSLGSTFNVNTGVFSISVSSDNNGPAATFLIGKTNQLSNASSINRISSSPSSTNTQLRLRWLANSGIEISKTNTNNDGDYNITDNFQNKTSVSITLTGTNITNIPQSFFRFYENKSFIGRIYSNILVNAPMLIILMSKNDYTTSGTRFNFNVRGSNTNEIINLNWNPNSLLTINKSGLNYDGIYNLDIIELQ